MEQIAVAVVGHREPEPLVGNIDRAAPLVAFPVEVKRASEALASPQADLVHQRVLILLQLGVLRPPERMNNLHDRTTGLLLRSSSVLVGEPLRSSKVTNSRCSVTLDVLDHVPVAHVTGVAGL
jgi:hypothetical protein